MKQSPFQELRFVVFSILALVASALWQGAATAVASPSPPRAPVAGQKVKLSGVIVKREGDSFVLRDPGRGDVTVTLTSSTKVEEKKSNPFRHPKRYNTNQLLVGLNVEVEGRSESSGAITAYTVRAEGDDLKVAQTVESRVTPVEGRVTEGEKRLADAEKRLAEAEQNAQRLSGQMEELNAISNSARGGAKAAQETADAALAAVKSTNQRISSLVEGLDDYEAKGSATLYFKSGSSVLTSEAQASLDQIAEQAKTEKAFVIEVRGYASSEGGSDLNRHLSQRRADAVVRYLEETHLIPLRRIITPFGYGAMQPVADNKTRSGREKNRRVEVTILVNRGLTSSAPASGVKAAATPR